MVNQTPPLQQSEKVPQLIGRDGIAHAHIDAAALFERSPAVDTDDPALGIEQAAAGIPRIDRRIDLQAVGILEDRAGGKLVASHPRYDAGADRGLEVGRQQERVAGGEAEVAHLDVVAVGQFGRGKVVASEELDQRDVPCRVEAHEHGVVEPTVGEPALHRDARRLDDVKIGEGVAVGTDEHTRTAPGLSREDRHRRSRRPPHDVDPLLLGAQHGSRDVAGVSWQRGDGRHHSRRDKHHANSLAGLHHCRGPPGCRGLIQNLLHEQDLPHERPYRSLVLLSRGTA